MHHTTEFEKQTELIKNYGDNAYTLWALGLYLDEPDLDALSARSLTDGANDKCIDFIEIDKTGQKLVIVQGYFTKKNNDKAPAKKASDINTAVAWFASGDINAKTINERVKVRIKECRELIDNEEIEQIELLYIHNLPESVNTEEELKTCEINARRLFENNDIEVYCREIGRREVEALYIEKSSPILISEKIKIEGEKIGEIGTSDWDAHIFNVQGVWLRDLFRLHDDKLFSANYRGFLGINRRKKINSGIKNTAEKQPKDFWVFNNGVTLITKGIEETEINNKKQHVLKGVSIINGAQTTGSLGSIEASINIDDVQVMCRVVVCKNPNKIDEIVKYNNTQNKITTWDQYANDETQKILQEQFKRMNYDYSLKRGFDASTSEIGIEKVAQPILAFNGYFLDANRSKNSIFEGQEIYKRAFTDRSASHVLLAFCFARSIDMIKLQLQQKIDRTTNEEDQLNLFNYLSFKNFLLASIGKCMEPFINRKYNVSDLKINSAIKSTIPEIAAHLEPITRQVLRGVARELKDLSVNSKLHISDCIKKEDAINTITPKLNSYLEGVIDGNSIYDFSEYVYSEKK